MATKTRKNNSDYIIQGTILAAAGILVRIIGLFYRVPLQSILGDEGSQIYNFAYEIYSLLLLISSNSIPIAISKMVSAKMAAGQARNSVRILKVSLVLATLSGALFALIIYVFSWQFAMFSEFVETVYALRMLAPALFVLAIMGVFRGYFQGQGTMVPTAISQIIEGVINAVVTVLGAYFFARHGLKLAQEQGNVIDRSGKTIAFMHDQAWGAAGAAFGTVVSALIGLAFLIFVMLIYRKVMKRQVKRDLTRKLDSYQDISRIFMITIIPIVLSTVVYNLTNMIDNTLFAKLQRFHGVDYELIKKTAGIYGTKFRTLMNVPLSLASCLTPSLIPGIVAAKMLGDIKDVKHRVHTAMRYTMVITIPCSVGMIALASPIMSLLFADDTAFTAWVVASGSLMIVFLAISTLGNGILQGIDQLKAPIVNGVVALLAHVILLVAMLYFFPATGIFAVIISNIFYAVMMTVLNQMSIKKYLHYKQEMSKTFIIPTAASLLMGIAAFLVNFLLEKLIAPLGLGIRLGSAVTVVPAIGIAVAVYAVALLKLKGLTEPEILGLPKGAMLARMAKKFKLL